MKAFAERRAGRYPVIEALVQKVTVTSYVIREPAIPHLEHVLALLAN